MYGPPTDNYRVNRSSARWRLWCCFYYWHFFICLSCMFPHYISSFWRLNSYQTMHFMPVAIRLSNHYSVCMLVCNFHLFSRVVTVTVKPMPPSKLIMYPDRANKACKLPFSPPEGSAELQLCHFANNAVHVTNIVCYRVFWPAVWDKSNGSMCSEVFLLHLSYLITWLIYLLSFCH